MDPSIYLIALSCASAGSVLNHAYIHCPSHWDFRIQYGMGFQQAKLLPSLATKNVSLVLLYWGGISQFCYKLLYFLIFDFGNKFISKKDLHVLASFLYNSDHVKIACPRGHIHLLNVAIKSVRVRLAGQCKIRPNPNPWKAAILIFVSMSDQHSSSIPNT